MTKPADGQIAKARERYARAEKFFDDNYDAMDGLDEISRAVRFAESERQAVIEECRRKLCVYCNNANSWNPATNGKHAYKFGPDERFCDARAIRSME